MKLSGITLVLISLLTFSFSSNIQSDSSGCSTYFPISVGMKWTMKNMDKKGKEIGKVTMKVIDSKPAEAGIVFIMESEYSVEKEDEKQKTEFEYSCVDNVLKMNMDQFFPAEMMENESLTFDIDTDGMEIPNSLTAGQKLKDASVSVIGKMEGIKVVDLTVTVTDRTVEKFEDVTTSAGQFNCAKITSKTNMKMGFINKTTSSIDWVSKDVGMVKSESYDKKGKLDGSTELVEFTR
ncbi:MAG: hypothetical protein AB8B72_00870 [Crocinitomicaceae bacterium]